MYQVSARSQTDMKLHNLKLVYDMIKNESPISRAAIAKRSGLSATSMTRIIGRLIAAGLVSERSTAANEGKGRPGTMLDIRADAGMCLCIDATVNRSKVALIDLANTICAYREILIPAKKDFRDVVRELDALLPELCREAGVDRRRVLCCGMSVSGHVIQQTGFIAASSQFEWFDIEAGRILESVLSMPAYVENDCKAALIGEETLLDNEARRSANIAYIKLGWCGVGSAAIIDGRLVRGSRNAAGEVGHFSAMPEGDVEKCEHRGCFENVISEAAVVARAQRVNASYGSLERINEGLAAGDGRLRALIDEVCEYIAIAINDISCAYNPDTIVLNGNLVAGCDYCMRAVRRYLAHRLLKSVQPNLTVRLSKKGTNAGLYGIGCIAVEAAVRRLLASTEETEEKNANIL